jgi:putative ABC transport system permease protein
MTSKLISLLPYWCAVVGIAFLMGRNHGKISREILWASLRTTAQLILLAFSLDVIFERTEMIVSLAVALLMTLNSSIQIVSRSKISHFHFFWISFVSNVVSIWPIAFLFSLDKGGESWLEARSVLPLLGMILGNSFSGVSTAITIFVESFKDKKTEVLTLLALGATTEEATRPIYFRSLRAGLTPQINAMLAMGIVSIPGMMAGQLMSDISGLDAAIIQIKMMLSIVVGTVLCIVIALKFIQKKMFLPTGELCFE